MKQTTSDSEMTVCLYLFYHALVQCFQIAHDKPSPWNYNVVYNWSIKLCTFWDFLFTLTKIINATLLFLPPFFMSWTQRSKTFSMYTKGLTAGMSTRAVARELNVHFYTISHLQSRFREFGSTSNRPHNCIPRSHTIPGPPHPASSPPRSSETSYPDSCCNNRFA